MTMVTWEYMGVYGEMWKNHIVVFGPGTIHMGRITVVAPTFPMIISMVCYMTYKSDCGLPHGDGFFPCFPTHPTDPRSHPLAANH